jgi:hypothetical protein
MSKYTSRSATNRAYSSSLVDKFIARVEAEKLAEKTDKPLKK